MAKKKIPVTIGSTNIFADLGYPDAEEMLAKAQLAARISEIINQRHLTQKAAADVLGIDQPKISALLRGRLRGFSYERLMRFLVILGYDVQITVIRPKARTRTRAHLYVNAA